MGPPHDDARDPRTDEELVAALNRADLSAFDTLYQRHSAFVYRVARRFAPDDAAAQDAVQDAFSYFLRQFPGFTLASRLTTYLYPLARNAAITQRRKSRRLVFRTNPESPLFPEPAAAAPAPQEDTSAALSRALATLPDAQREVVLMRAIDEMSTAEIAAALGIPQGTVKSRLHAALAALRAHPGLTDLFE